jgi:hypothetical protein
VDTQFVVCATKSVTQMQGCYMILSSKEMHQQTVFPN